MSKTLVLDPGVGYMLVVAYSLFFGWAAHVKCSNVSAFAAVFRNYNLVPQRWAPIAAFSVPLCEAVIAVLLVIPNTRALAALTGSSLCLIYALAIGINLWRGRRDLDCGCAGPLERRPISGWMLWRNLALATTLLAICLPWSSRSLEGTDLVTIGGGAAGLVLLYVTLDYMVAIVMSRTELLRTTQ